MENINIYESIGKRTGGDIYIGVVGPVRAGKSTFIKRFMELMVLPGVTDVYEKERMLDEMPQSGTGRTEVQHSNKQVIQSNITYTGNCFGTDNLVATHWFCK